MSLLKASLEVGAVPPCADAAESSAALVKYFDFPSRAVTTCEDEIGYIPLMFASGIFENR